MAASDRGQLRARSSARPRPSRSSLRRGPRGGGDDRRSQLGSATGSTSSQLRAARAGGGSDGTAQRKRTHRFRASALRRHAGRGDRQDVRHPGQCRQAHDFSRGPQAAAVAGTIREVFNMQHLTEQELVLHHYHDDESPAIGEHLASCEVCRAEYNSIRRVLALVDEMPVPERGEGYGQQVWSRLRWRLGSRNKRRTWVSGLAAAAVLAIAFFTGQWWQARHATSPVSVTAGASPAARPAGAPASTPATQDRILFVVVTDHLDSSERMLSQV